MEVARTRHCRRTFKPTDLWANISLPTLPTKIYKFSFASFSSIHPWRRKSDENEIDDACLLAFRMSPAIRPTERWRKNLQNLVHLRLDSQPFLPSALVPSEFPNFSCRYVRANPRRVRERASYTPEKYEREKVGFSLAHLTKKQNELRLFIPPCGWVVVAALCSPFWKGSKGKQEKSSILDGNHFFAFFHFSLRLEKMLSRKPKKKTLLAPEKAEEFFV